MIRMCARTHARTHASAVLCCAQYLPPNARPYACTTHARTRRYDFNEFRSREIGERRQAGWPNSRSRQCNSAIPNLIQQTGVVLEPTSVIICFVNEEWFALWRTINAVIDLSPPELLREIVLVDDGSDAPDMGEPLERAIRRHPAYHLIKL